MMKIETHSSKGIRVMSGHALRTELPAQDHKNSVLITHKTLLTQGPAFSVGGDSAA